MPRRITSTLVSSPDQSNHTMYLGCALSLRDSVPNQLAVLEYSATSVNNSRKFLRWECQIVKPTPNAQRKVVNASRNEATLLAACRFDSSKSTTHRRGGAIVHIQEKLGVSFVVIFQRYAAAQHLPTSTTRIVARRSRSGPPQPAGSGLQAHADLLLRLLIAADVRVVQAIHRVLGGLRAGRRILSTPMGHGKTTLLESS